MAQSGRDAFTPQAAPRKVDLSYAYPREKGAYPMRIPVGRTRTLTVGAHVWRGRSPGCCSWFCHPRLRTTQGVGSCLLAGLVAAQGARLPLWTGCPPLDPHRIAARGILTWIVPSEDGQFDPDPLADRGRSVTSQDGSCLALAHIPSPGAVTQPQTNTHPGRSKGLPPPCSTRA